MRPYATVVPTFWAAFRSRIVRECGTDAQTVLLLALYCISSPNSNMVGLYYLPLPTIAHETGLTLQQVTNALEHLKKLDFCLYNADREVIWVIKMAKFQIGEALSAGDKRCAMVRKELLRLGENEFTQQFIGLYSVNYHLNIDAPSKPLPASIVNVSDAPSKPLARPLGSTTDAPLKPLECASEGSSTSVIQEQEQEHYKIREHDQKNTPAPDGASPTPVSFLEIWNANCGQLPKVSEITNGRERKLKARLKAKPDFAKDFTDAVKHAATNAFLSGDNDRGWKAGFDWLIANDTNHVAVLEGKYDAKSQVNSGKANGERTGATNGAGVKRNTGAYRGDGSSANRFERDPDLVF